MKINLIKYGMINLKHIATVHGKYLAEKILANHTGKSYWQGNTW